MLNHKRPSAKGSYQQTGKRRKSTENLPETSEKSKNYRKIIFQFLKLRAPKFVYIQKGPFTNERILPYPMSVFWFPAKSPSFFHSFKFQGQKYYGFTTR
jgi:hypothetical protein